MSSDRSERRYPSSTWHYRQRKYIFEVFSGKKKANKRKHFGQDGVRDKQEPSLNQMGTRPWDKQRSSLGQTGRFYCLITVKSPLCPISLWNGWGSSPGTIVPRGASEKENYVFCVYRLFLLTIILHVVADTDTGEHFGINVVADADTAVPPSLERATEQIKIISDILSVSEKKQIQRKNIFKVFPPRYHTKELSGPILHNIAIVSLRYF